MRTFRALQYRYAGYMTKDRREKLVLPLALICLVLLMPWMFMYILENRPSPAGQGNTAPHVVQPGPAERTPTPATAKPSSSTFTSTPISPNMTAGLPQSRADALPDQPRSAGPSRFASAPRHSPTVPPARPVRLQDLEGVNRTYVPPDFFDNVPGPVFHVVSHTHWDREWYLPFESFRGRLVKLIDRIFDTMAKDDNFRHFHFDGQLIPIEDYLEIRPSMRETVIRANLEGKISLGPWYIQPDEYLVSAEALVRNLLIGMRLSNELGGTVRLGYVPDSFGHISQLPQMLLGFGINNFISGRGPISKKASPESIWRGPDGSEVLFIYLKAWYCNALDMPAENNPRQIQNYLNKKQKELKDSATKHILLMNGCDHSSPDPRIGSAIASMTQANAMAQGQMVVHTNLEHYVSLIGRELGRNSRTNSLTKYEGELRNEIDHLAGTLSTKIGQKQMNWALQNLLELWAEPLSVYTELFGGEPYDQDTLTYAWKKLLQNHPHDSICGCSSQEVHLEVDTRFAKVKQVVEGLLNERALKLAALLHQQFQGVLTSSASDVVVAVFNPTNTWRQEVVVTDVAANLRSPIARDSEGRSVSTTLLAASLGAWSYELPDIGFRKPLTNNRIVVAFHATVPPLGYALYSIGENRKQGIAETVDRTERLGFGRNRKLNTETIGTVASELQWDNGNTRRLQSRNDPRRGRSVPGLHDPASEVKETREIPGFHNPGRGRDNQGRGRPSSVVGRQHRPQESAMTGDQTIENDYLEVAIYKDGSVDIKDKSTNLVYHDLNIIFDEDDKGDEYKFAKGGSPQVATGTEVEEPVRTSTGQACHVRALLRGTPLDIFFLISKGSRRLEVRVELDNQRSNHRIRAQFHLRGEPDPLIFADGQFEVLRRGKEVEHTLQFNAQLAIRVEWI